MEDYLNTPLVVQEPPKSATKEEIEDCIEILRDSDRLRDIGLRHVDRASARAQIPIGQVNAYDEYRKTEMVRQIAEYLMHQGVVTFETERNIDTGMNAITASLTVLVPEEESPDGQSV